MSDSDSKATAIAASPQRCFIGSVVAGGLGYLMYRMTVAIATTFANKPVSSSNPTVISISSAVRTLVTGVVALGAGVFGIAAVGLLLLGVQILFQRLRGDSTVESEPQSEPRSEPYSEP